MLNAYLLLGLAATAAAIDIRFHYGDDQGKCEAAYTACVGSSARNCCVYGGTYASTASVVAVPSAWTITANGYRGRGCEVQQFQGIGRGKDVCLGHVGPSYSGAFYYFGGKKRDEDQKCEGEQRVNQLGLEDGTIYDIVGLSDNEIDEMVCFTLLIGISHQTQCQLTVHSKHHSKHFHDDSTAEV